jgi:hypothetical protein
MAPRTPILLITLAAALTATAPAAGRTIRLQMDDVVDVTGTRIACVALTSSGKRGVACLLWRGGKPLTASVGAGLAEDGTAVLTRVKADGSSQQILKRRSTALRAAERVHRVRVGDVFGFPITSSTSLGCKVLRITDPKLDPLFRGVRVSCWRATTTAPLPRSWGMSISDRMAGVFRFDARGEVSSVGVVRRQPG